MHLPRYARLARALALLAPAATAGAGCVGTAHADARQSSTNACPSSAPRENSPCTMTTGQHCNYTALNGRMFDCQCVHPSDAPANQRIWSCAPLAPVPGPLPPPELPGA
jgi:hypothetical protein